MDLSLRLMLRLIWLASAWAIDTPFEPLVTGLRRAKPVEVGEVIPQALCALESHLLDWARVFRAWILSGFILYALTAVTSAILVYIGPLTPIVWSVFIIVIAVGFALWCSAMLVHILRSMKDPSYSFADQLAVSLKRRTLDQEAALLLAGLPSDSALRVYYGRLMPPRSHPLPDEAA